METIIALSGATQIISGAVAHIRTASMITPAPAMVAMDANGRTEDLVRVPMEKQGTM
jgi:hypothetical protein